MNHLIAIHAENRRTQDPLIFGIHQHLHESLHFSGFARSADTLHRHLAEQSLAPAGEPVQPLGHAIARMLNNPVFTRFNARHLDVDSADCKAKLVAPATPGVSHSSQPRCRRGW